MMVLGALGYVYHDYDNHPGTYLPLVMYYLSISVEAVWGKRVTQLHPLHALGSCLLTNLMTLPFITALSIYLHPKNDWGLGAVSENLAVGYTLASSVLASVGIGAAGWRCRGLVTATTFSVVGVVAKVVTVAVSTAVFGTERRRESLFSLLLCVVGGAMYEQPGTGRGRMGGRKRSR